MDDILRKLGKEVVDQTWSTVNQVRDTAFLTEQSERIERNIDILSGRSGGLWDRFVRFILSLFPGFDDLAVLEGLLSDVPGFEHIKIPKEQLLRIYQKIQDTKFVQERDKIRTYIMTESESLGLDAEYLQTFTRGALWDRLSFSGVMLQGAENMVTEYTKNLDAQVRGVIQVIPLRDLDTKARETLRTLLK